MALQAMLWRVPAPAGRRNPSSPHGEHSPLGLFFGEGGDGFAACLVRGINTENRPARGGCLHHHCPKLVSSDPRRERQRREHERGQRQRRDHHRRNVNPASPNRLTHVLISRTSNRGHGTSVFLAFPCRRQAAPLVSRSESRNRSQGFCCGLLWAGHATATGPGARGKPPGPGVMCR